MTEQAPLLLREDARLTTVNASNVTTALTHEPLALALMSVFLLCQLGCICLLWQCHSRGRLQTAGQRTVDVEEAVAEQLKKESIKASAKRGAVGGGGGGGNYNSGEVPKSAKKSGKNTRQRVWYLAFEFFIFIRALQSSVAGLAVTVLVQDKLCLNVYRQSADFCRRIGEHNGTLSAVIKYFMECLPVLTWSLFVGSFLDNYRGGTRLLFTLSIVGSLLAGTSYLLNELFFRSWSHYLLLLASATYWITGGQASYMTVTYRYIVMNSGEKLCPLKSMLFQFAIVTGFFLGTFIGGQLLITSSEDDTVPFRTYNYNFALYLVIDLLCLPLAF
ncbi:hypothetical protein TYRP_012807 [Tyrophagus putrescentiae]|nr:hypothetical protein TYRP_012807 [Tyrophagus putrescentiae]